MSSRHNLSGRGHGARAVIAMLLFAAFIIQFKWWILGAIALAAALVVIGAVVRLSPLRPAKPTANALRSRHNQRASSRTE